MLWFSFQKINERETKTSVMMIVWKKKVLFCMLQRVKGIVHPEIINLLSVHTKDDKYNDNDKF